jgi:hypothetical protein
MMSFRCTPAISFDIDHIIPQSLFDSSSIPKAGLIKNTLFNLCPLPTKDNIRKNNSILSDIKDSWLIGQIEYFSTIKEKDFKKFSTVNNWEQLRNHRKNVYETNFIEKRKQVLNS